MKESVIYCRVNYGFLFQFLNLQHILKHAFTFLTDILQYSKHILCSMYLQRQDFYLINKNNLPLFR